MQRHHILDLWTRATFPRDTLLRSSHKPAKELHRWSHTNVVGRDIVFRAGRRDLPRLAFRKSRLQVSEPAIDRCIAPLALDKELWSPAARPLPHCMTILAIGQKYPCVISPRRHFTEIAVGRTALAADELSEGILGGAAAHSPPRISSRFWPSFHVEAARIFAASRT